MSALTPKGTGSKARTTRARAAKGSVSKHLRASELPLPTKQASVKLVVKKHPVSGASYIAWPVGPKVSFEEIKEAISNSI